jgi:hypothetical protein
MSGSKFTLAIFATIFAMTSIAYLVLDVPDFNPISKDNIYTQASYTTFYLLGFSLPLIGAGTFLSIAVNLVLRTKKVRMRKSV